MNREHRGVVHKMPRVALDFAGHWEARSGIWRYGVALARALVRLGRCESIRIPCFDRLPASSTQELAATGADVIARGPQQRLDQLESMARRRGRFVPWNRVVPWVLDHGLREIMLRRGLGDADVYHSLSLLRNRVGSARVAATILDLIPLTAPDLCTVPIDRFRRELEHCRRESDVVIVPSYATKADLIEAAGFDSSQIRVIYLGIDHDCFRPQGDRDSSVLRRHGLEDRNYLLYVGAIDRRKNLSTLLDAYLLARRSAAISLPLVLAGPIIGDMHAFIERLQRPECRDCVRFLGYCSDSDLPALYRGARAFCFVSLYEGFGFPPLEAMACGTPVIASETSSVGEIVGEAAAKVNPRNVEEIAEAIGVLCSDAETWSRFRNAGIERAGQFTWESAAEQTWRAYVNALDESSEAGLPTCTTQRIAS